MIGEAARQAGARIIATGDTAQLGAVEAGGMFRLLAQEVPAAQLHEVRRFDAAWERDASIRLRDGDLAAVAVYDRHGRIRGADEEAGYDRAASMWLADYLRGKNVLLLAGSNAEAAGLSRRVQAKLTQMGSVGPPQALLSDGNHAGVGDLVRARLNTEIDAGGRALANRDTLAVTAFCGPDAEVRRQRPDGTWTQPFRLPRSYLARHAELAYAGNVHVAQGRTVDTAHLLITDSLSCQALYVGMTRGREANTAHVVTGDTAPPGHQPYRQAVPESVLAGVLQRDAEDLSATEQIRQAQDWAGGTGHLLNLWTAAVRQTRHRQIDERIRARLTDSEAWRYEQEHSRQALQHKLRAAQLAGHDIDALIDRITAAPMDRAKSISSVLHGRLQRLALPGLRHDVTWAQRTPASAPAVARELAAALDDRTRALGERLAASPEPWLARQLGVLAPDASPALREEYTRRAGIAAAYREAAGITNPDQAASLEPHRGNPELEAMRKAVFATLEIRDEADILHGIDRGELEARVLQGERARAAAPPDVSSQLRLTAYAEADAHRQSADAHAQHDDAAAASTTALAAQLAAERHRLEAGNARYEQWSADTHATRDAAGKATAELQRRRYVQPDSEPNAQPEDEPQLLAGWWQQLETDAEAVNCADASEHQAAIDAEESEASQRIADMNPPSASISEPPTSPQTESAQQNREARLDELLARADQAAQRIAAQQAERHASSEYAARIELEAQIQAEAGQQAEARDEAELELLRGSLSALPNEPVDQLVHQGYRLRLTAAHIGQDPARQVRDREREEQAVQVCLNSMLRSGQAESEAVGLGAWVGEGDLEGAVGDGAGLADELYTRCCERVPSPSTSLPWASPGGCPSMKTRHRTGVPGAAGPMTGLRSRRGSDRRSARSPRSAWWPLPPSSSPPTGLTGCAPAAPGRHRRAACLARRRREMRSPRCAHSRCSFR